MRRIFYLLFAGIIILAGSGAFASFEDIGYSARSSGLANACVSVSNDANAVVTNPAGLYQINKNTATTTYAILYPYLDEGNLFASFVSYVNPLWISGLYIGTAGIFYSNLESKQLYSEQVYGLSYGRTVQDVIPYVSDVWRRPISVGMNLKIMTRKYEINTYTLSDPLFANGTSSSGFGLDLGLMGEIIDNLNAGVYLENLTQPNMALSKTDKDNVPLGLKVGAGYYIGEKREYLATAQFNMRGKDLRFLVGGEAYFLEKMLTARIGFGIGNNSFRELSAGGSYLTSQFGNDLSVDYAYVMPLNELLTTGGQHRFSVSFSFGRTAREYVQEEVDKRITAAKEVEKAGYLITSYFKWKDVLKIDPNNEPANTALKGYDENKFFQWEQYYFKRAEEEMAGNKFYLALRDFKETLLLESGGNSDRESLKIKARVGKSEAENKIINMTETPLKDGIELFSNQKYEDAKTKLEWVIDINPDDAQAREYLSKTNEKLKEIAEKQKRMEESESARDRGDRYYNEEKYAEAYIEYKKAVDLNKENSAAESKMILLKERLVNLAENKFNDAKEKFNAKEYDSAYELFSQANVLNPDKGEYKDWMNKSKEEKKKWDEEQKRLKLEKERKQEANKRYIMGVNLYNAKQYFRAITEFKEALKKDPELSGAKDYLEKAQTELAKVTKNLFEKGKLLFNEGKYKDAAMTFNDIMQVNPDFKEAKEWLEKAKEKLK